MAEWDEIAQRAWDAWDTNDWGPAVGLFIREAVDALKEDVGAGALPQNRRDQTETFLVHAVSAAPEGLPEVGGGLVGLALFLSKRLEDERSLISKVQLVFAALVLAHQAGRGAPAA